MKRFFSIVLTFFMMISNTCVVFANEDVELYAYTSDTTGYDEYASDNLGDFIYGHYGYIDDKIELGKGITIFNENDYPKVLYPVWKNNEVIATFIVVNVDGIFSGTYSEANVSKLNELINLTSFDNPLRLIKYNNNLYFYLNSIMFSNSSNIESFVLSNSFEDNEIINVYEKITCKAIVGPRVPGSFTQDFLRYHINSDDSMNCYAYSLSNILRNLGYSKYTFDYVYKNVKTSSGLYGGFMGVTEIRNFLNEEEFTYSSADSGYLSLSSIQNYLYTNDNYIMVGLSFVGSSIDHYSILIGYSMTSTNTLYTIWDPQSEGNVRHTMLASTRTYTNGDGNTFVWDEGYFANFRK